MNLLFSDIQLMIACSLILLGIIQLVYRNSGPFNQCMSVAFFSLGYVLLYLRSISPGGQPFSGILANTENAATFFSGPAIYLTISTLIEEKATLPDGYRKHFILPIAVMLGTIAFNAFVFAITGSLPHPWDYARPQNHFGGNQLFSLLADIDLFGYCAYTLIGSLILRKKGSIESSAHYRLLMFLLSCITPIALSFVVLCFFPEPLMSLVLSYLCGILVMAFGILSFRYPEYMHRVLKTVSGQNRRKELLDRNDVDALMETLVALMEKDRVYRNPGLTIEDVGGYMNVPPQTVSLLVNRKTGVNFRTWLNAWRVQAVCAQLVRESETSILDISFENGFNSKSAFNAAFQEITGMTPRDFRKATASRKASSEPAQTLKLPSFVKSSVAK